MQKSKHFTALDLTIGSIFIALMAVGANITSIAPFMVVGGVPITLQTFFAILAGLILGSRMGTIAMIAYTLLGLAGAPIFSQFSGGISTILSPTFGFILSYIIMAYVTGKIVEKKRSLPLYLIASFVALIINYLIGTNWMYGAYLFWFDAPSSFSYKLVWYWMAVPLPKDVILTICAGVFAYRMENRILSKSRYRQQHY
ncbi:biotin transporter BioY [Gracilibacillus sp. S3-1-1]|uniref:Biotin transporter BioY n=1 Tax=Gracilibacillus pellucidus TaxID=3095368 RepID=A0ACC6M9J3_9BACI|nr:biotin transporter BioY [Gracilibacillus sp. S3-1-1]MDX8047558.1 biotin transporter BioY [Gracilibacillus sp. S3-1-1]